MANCNAIIVFIASATLVPVLAETPNQTLVPMNDCYHGLAFMRNDNSLCVWNEIDPICFANGTYATEVLCKSLNMFGSETAEFNRDLTKRAQQSLEKGTNEDRLITGLRLLGSIRKLISAQRTIHDPDANREVNHSIELQMSCVAECFGTGKAGVRHLLGHLV